jgi:hypothetical protein
MKASNPFSLAENLIPWLGWENGFASTPNSIISPLERAEFGPQYEKAFYRGQGAQITRKYCGEGEHNYNRISNLDGV